MDAPETGIPLLSVTDPLSVDVVSCAVTAQLKSENKK
jgi:hypothetical protein